MDTNATQYKAFMVRFWREADGSLRATVHDPHNNVRAGFTSQAALLTFLTEQISQIGTADSRENQILTGRQR